MENLKTRLQLSESELADLRAQHEALQASYGNISADQVKQLVATVSSLRQKVDYYRKNVLAGPRSFLEMADGFEDYPNAILRKLLREIEEHALISEVR